MRSFNRASAQGCNGTWLFGKSAARLRTYLGIPLVSGTCQSPERSGFPSDVRGGGAERSGFPSLARGMPGVFKGGHCEDAEPDRTGAATATDKTKARSRPCILTATQFYCSEP